MTPTVGGGPSSGGLAVFDATGDGIPDLVVAGSAILVFPGKGDGTFAEAPIVTLLGDYSLFNIAFADLNHDGKIDLVGGGQFQNGYSLVYGLGVLLGNGDGTFGSMNIFPINLIPPLFFEFGQCVLVDLNDDGILDAVMVGSSSSGSGVQAWLGSGDGGFGAAIASPASAGAVGYWLAVADFNGDGKPDLAVTDVTGVQVWLGDGTGHFTQGPNVADEANTTGVAAGDLNRDGFADIVIVAEFREHATIVLGNGDGTFQPPTHTPLGDALWVALGDINADGIPDLVADGAAPGALVALGNGDGTFQRPQQWYVSSPANYGLALADLRNGGGLDIVTAGYNISVLLHTGPATFMEGIPYPLSGAGCVAAADFNGDGKPDVAVNMSSGFQILFGTGEAEAPFTAGPITQAGAGCGYTGDFNNDGIPDLAVLEGNPSEIYIDLFLGNGDGTFQAPFSISAPSDAGELAVGDVRGNGMVDVITNTGDLLLGNGDGTLQPAVYLFPGQSDSPIMLRRRI